MKKRESEKNHHRRPIENVYCCEIGVVRISTYGFLHTAKRRCERARETPLIREREKETESAMMKEGRKAAFFVNVLRRRSFVRTTLYRLVHTMVAQKQARAFEGKH